MIRLGAAMAVLALLMVGCGGSRDAAQPPAADDTGAVDDATDAGDTDDGVTDDGVTDPDDPVGTEEPMDPDLPMDEEHETWTLVEPTPGMDDVRAIEWDDVQLLDEPRVRVRYWSGVEPCHVLDSVEVEETDETVTITLYEGSEPQPGGEMPVCIQIARWTAVDVRLDAPVGDREIVDGAASR